MDSIIEVLSETVLALIFAGGCIIGYRIFGVNETDRTWNEIENGK